MLEQNEAAAAAQKQRPTQDAKTAEDTQPVELEQLREKPRNMPALAIRAVMERVPLLITVELGRAEISLKDLRALRQGQVITLNRIVGEPLGIYANGQHLGHGEVVAVAKDQYGIRVTALAGDPKAEPQG
jgi:flagellar motor switch protein FliN